MKAYDMQPTPENVKATFIKDSIERNRDVVRFCTILDSIEDCCSIALDGKWGSGKTFFVKQVKMLMDVFNDFADNNFTEAEIDQIKKVALTFKPERDKELELQLQVIVYYDAWASDNDEDPILSLLYAIVQSASTDFTVLKKLDYLKIAGDVIELFTGKKVSNFFESLKGTNPLAGIKKNKSISDLMSSFFTSLLPEHGNRLVVIIDELDRCKPSYAVQLLERVKHYFADARITFVFSVNTEQLQHTIKKYYGDDFDASRYLDRFFDLRITLPPANLQKYFEIIAFSKSSYFFDEMCHMVMEAYHFELREIAKYVRLTKIAAYKPTHDNRYDFSFSEGKALLYAFNYFIPIMIGLKIRDESTYFEFVSGKNSIPILDVLKRADPDFFRINTLLNRNETCDSQKISEKGVLVTSEDKIKEVYEALYLQDYNGKIREKRIGELTFGIQLRAKVLRIVSLLSSYADYTQ